MENSQENIIFLRDCPRKDIWRNNYYDAYKANRDVLPGSGKVFKGGPFFKYTYSTILPELQSKFGLKTFIHDSLEGGDLIFN